MDPNIGLQIAFVKVAELIRVIYSEAMAAPKLPSLLELFKAEKPSDLVAGLPTPLVAKLYEQMKAVRDQLGGANVPPDPVSMAAKYHKWKWLESRHLTFISEKVAETIATGSAIYVATPPRHAKPVWIEELVLTKSGERVRLGDIKIGDEVLTHEGRFRRVTDVIERPAEPTLRVSTWCGRTVVTTPDHPFLTARGWTQAADLKPNDILGTPIPEATDTMGGKNLAEAARLAGYFVGDGSTSYHPPPKRKKEEWSGGISSSITCFDPVQAEDMRYCAEALGFTFNQSSAKSANGGLFNISGGSREWLKANDLVGTSHSKRVPSFVFAGGKEGARNFVAGYFACDGFVQNRGSQRKSGPKRKDFVVEFVSVNEALVQDTQHLLLRLGIKSRIRHRAYATNYSKGVKVDSYHCVLSSQDDVDRFRKEIPVKGIKAQRLAALEIDRQAFDPTIYPDPVTIVEDAGIRDCRCLTVDGDHSFTVNDIAVKNSSLCSGWTPFWYLAKFPEAHVLLISYSATEARKWGFKVRTLIETYGAEYGLYMNAKKMASDDWELTSGGGMITLGIGSGLGGKPAQLLIIDDPIGNMEDANSQTMRDKLWDWWDGTAIQRIEPGTPIILIGTRYHTSDLMGQILAQSDAGDGIHFDKIVLPSKALADDPLGRPLGEGLWIDNPRPAYQQKFYDDREKNVSPYAYASVYQQDPVAAGGNMVDPEWWEYYTPAELPKDFDQVVQSWDLSLDSVKKSDSYHAGLVVARKGSLIFILDSFHKHCDINGVIDQILAWNRIYPEARQKLVERATSGVAVVQMLKSRVPGMLAWPPKGRQKGSKEACLDACIPDIRAHNIYLPKRPNGSREKWVDEFVMECMAFPRGAHDDWVDAFSQAVGFMLPAVRRVVAGETEDAMGQRPPLAPTEAHNQFLHATMNRLSARGLDQLKQAAGDGRRVIAFSRAQRIGLGAARRVC